MKRILVVLGMHRSGTSAITRGLQVFGVELGDRLIPPLENNNVTGFWEDADINALNQEMLEILGNDWHYLAPIQTDDIKVLRQKGYFLRAVELLRLKIGDAPVWGFKDPRVAKLLPFWKEVFSQCQLDVSYVLTLRHPLSVAKSLANRDGFDAGKSYFLWLGHVIASLSGTASEKRILIDYDRLLHSPDLELQRIADHLDLKIDPTELHLYKTSFLDMGLRHTVYDLSDLKLDDTCPLIIHDIYSELLKMATGKQSINDLPLQKKNDLWADELERLKSPFILVDKQSLAITERNEHVASLSQQLAKQKKQLSALDSELEDHKKLALSLNFELEDHKKLASNLDFELSEYKKQATERDALIQDLIISVQSIYQSNSWRITAPLRLSFTLMRRLFIKRKMDSSNSDKNNTNITACGHLKKEYLSDTQVIHSQKSSFLVIYKAKIRHFLESYPFLYELTRKFYKYISRSNTIIKQYFVCQDEFSTFHIAKSQGLIKTSSQCADATESVDSFQAHYEDNQNFSAHETDIKAVAFYLPQFHAIPENDEWWEKGFTEWTNTRKTKPLFPGHYQPREPHADIGYYDLTDIEVIKKQVQLAKAHGIYGFCFYHYWFHGKRLLGTPVDMVPNNPDIEMPFCLCWANETWSKKWDGKDHHILMKQIFSSQDDIEFIKFLAPFFHDPRYIRVQGKPVLLVYRISKLPNPMKTAQRWRNWCRSNGLGEIYLVSVAHGELQSDMPLDNVGFDAYAAFPPHNFHCDQITSDPDIFTGGYRFNYKSGIDNYSYHYPNTTVFEGCTLGWDNTARFGTKAQMYLNFSLHDYYRWLRNAMEYTRKAFQPEERYLFINAWNEWAEGTYLEPDKKYGYAYLNTTSKALFDMPLNLVKNDLNLNFFPMTSSKYTQDYEYIKTIINNGEENSLSKIYQYISDQNPLEILEFGPASGYFTRYLSEERNAVVDIAELDPDCASLASQYARDCCVGDIEAYAWKRVFAGREYDYILFADVLEHLKNPWSLLKESKSFLKPGGKILVSVPNIAHAQILASLYNNDFSYANVGILDKTHLRFFTETTLRDMIIDSGLQIVDLKPVIAPVLPEGCGTLRNNIKIPSKLMGLLREKPFADAIQFVACCQK